MPGYFFFLLQNVSSSYSLLEKTREVGRREEMDVLLPDFYVHADERQAAGSELVKPFQTRELIQQVTSLQHGAKLLNHGNFFCG
jgi:hypothetical protein